MNINEGLLKPEIAGIARVKGNYKNIVLNKDASYLDKNIKELIYATDMGDVEALIGFNNLNIVELKEDDERVNLAIKFLEDQTAEAVVFLEGTGYLVITDLTFFAGYIKESGKDTPYTEAVETNLYEDDEAMELIENEPRLQ